MTRRARGVQAGITPCEVSPGPRTRHPAVPALLVVPYGFTVDPDIRVPPVWLGVLAWIAIAALAVAAWRYRAWALAGLILLLPSSSIFPAADLAADRRMYLPLFAFAAAPPACSRASEAVGSPQSWWRSRISASCAHRCG